MRSVVVAIQDEVRLLRCICGLALVFELSQFRAQSSSRGRVDVAVLIAD
jgi:hypothetical protein